MDLSSFCVTVPNALDHRVCDELIAMYNVNQQLHERYDLDHTPTMTMLNFTCHKNIHEKLHDYLVDVSFDCLEYYQSCVPEAKFWPEKYSFESFRIKHYQEGGDDRFDEHVDSISLNTAKRFLIFFWYLNNVEEGGETEITNMRVKVKPEKGKLIMFPPFWMFPHIGHPVIKGEKFLLSSYMHYDERSE